MAFVWRRTPDVETDDRHRSSFDLLFAQATALALFLSPHLFMQDMLAWVIPLVLFYRQQGRSPGVARVGLCWPIVFAVSVVLDNSGPRWPFFNVSLAMTVALVIWMFRVSRRAVLSPAA